MNKIHKQYTLKDIMNQRGQKPDHTGHFTGLDQNEFEILDFFFSKTSPQMFFLFRIKHSIEP